MKQKSLKPNFLLEM